MPPQSSIQKKEEELNTKLKEIELKNAEKKYVDLAKKLSLPFSTLKGVPIDNDALNIVNEKTARKSNLAALYKNGSKLSIAVTDPENIETKKTLNYLGKNGFVVDLIITTPDALGTIWRRYKITESQAFRVGTIEINEKELGQLQEQIQNIGDIKNKLKTISITKIVEILIAGALKTLASDIHFEPTEDTTRIRYRLDGILHDIIDLDLRNYTQVLNRIKVLSKMKLNIHTSPQDGRFTIKQRDINIEVRVSTLPSEFGETTVMRLLDPRTIKVRFEDLGIRNDQLEILEEQLKKPTGTILTTGPTGSGKTTTLYALIQRLNSSGTKIITIEDPIEYHIEGISQTQINQKKGYTFANGLRAIVRQDPDIILVGEIRDKETADIALQAALTGHLVLSTIHTNNAAGTIPRLIDLGIQPQIIAPAIGLTIAQRLVRKLCPKCKRSVKATAEEFKKIKTVLGPIQERFHLSTSSPNIYGPAKCKSCNLSGYTGRFGIFEMFPTSKAVERLIFTSPSISKIEELVITEGMVTMLQGAYLRIIEGITSFEEIERVL